MQRMLKYLLILLTLLPVTANATQSDTDCLAEAIYFEGRGESFIGQLAIGGVVLNRTTDSVCQTVHHKNCQFSYWCDGKPERMSDRKALEVAYGAARLVLDGAVVARLETATHYHATYVNPRWSKELTYLDQIGKHIFYREE